MTNVSTSEDTQQSSRKPYQKLSSIDEWITSFSHEPTNDQIEFVKNLEQIVQKFGIGLEKGKIEYTSRFLCMQMKTGLIIFTYVLRKNDNIYFNLLRNHEKIF